MLKLYVNLLKISIFAFISTFFSTSISADQFHYKDIFIGERATGLGGAYSAISDDPSGSYYNPAGLAFSSKNYISVSMNTYKWNKAVYKNILDQDSLTANKDWESVATAFIPNFFGVVQDFDRFKLAISFIIPEGDESNQDSDTLLTFSDVSQNALFVRNYNEQNNLYLLGPSISYLHTEQLSFGASFFGTHRSREFTDNQWVYFTNRSNEWEWSNFYSEEKSYGMLGVFGTQYMPNENVSLAFVLKKNFLFSAKATQQNTLANQLGTGLTKNDFDLKTLDYFSIPTSMTFGGVYFFSPRFLITSDLQYFFQNKSDNFQFKKRSVTNFSLGSEYYITNNIPIRMGFYTNKANINTLFNGASNPNLLGITCSLGLETEVSTLSFGFDYSQGKGKYQFQDRSNNSVIVNSQHKTIHLFFSGTYQL